MKLAGIIAITLIVAGCGLFAYALNAEKYRHAEAYDVWTPIIAGAVCILIGGVILVVLAILHFFGS